MNDYKPLTVLPIEFQTLWGARLEQADDNPAGAFKLVNIRPTQPRTFEEQRIVVLVVDENGFPMPNIRVAFSYSTADQYILTPEFTWSPPPPQRAFIVPTQGSGQIDQIQGDGISAGGPGGVTVYIFEPEYSSDVVTGAGMLADHTGLHLTYQLRRAGALSLMERMGAFDHWVTVIESRLERLEAGLP